MSDDFLPQRHSPSVIRQVRQLGIATSHMEIFPFQAIQQDLIMLPVKTVNELPPRTTTADAIGEVEGEDGLFYHVKGDQSGHPVCASEWICTNLAEEVGIGSPPRTLIEMFDGRQVFGSRRIAGVANETATEIFLTTASNVERRQSPASLCSILSKIYAFDMFINNVDRHFGNYLSSEEAGIRRLYAMDNSRALFFRWPLIGFPLSHEHTRTRGRILRDLHGFDLAAAVSVTEKLSRLAPAIVEGLINRMPPSWLKPNLRRELIEWWSNGGRINRIIDLDAGLSSGTLL